MSFFCCRKRKDEDEEIDLDEARACLLAANAAQEAARIKAGTAASKASIPSNQRSIATSRGEGSPSAINSKYELSDSSYLVNSMHFEQSYDYIKRLEEEMEMMQQNFLRITTQFARLQFRLRQVFQAEEGERGELLKELERVTFTDTEELDSIGSTRHEERLMGGIRSKQVNLINNLRNQLVELTTANQLEAQSDIYYKPETFRKFSVNRLRSSRPVIPEFKGYTFRSHDVNHYTDISKKCLGKRKKIKDVNIK